MPFPPAHIFVGIGAAELVRGDRMRPPWRVWIVAALVALLPDVDVVLRALGTPGLIDRNFTHSLLAVAATAALAWMTAGRLWSAVAAAAYGSHLVADLLQTQGRTSVALFWPLLDRGMDPVAHLFPRVPIARGAGLRGAAVSLLEPAAISPLLVETAIGGAIFVCCLAAAVALRRRRAAW